MVNNRVTKLFIFIFMDQLVFENLGLLLAGFLIWLTILSFFLTKTLRFGQFGSKSSSNFNKILTENSKKLTTLVTRTGQLEKSLAELERQVAAHIQRVAVKRFNPFDDVGGDQSFSVAFLDGENNGVVVSSLHSRSGTRVYAKPVEAGKSVDFELSKEEKEVLKMAAKK